MPGLIALLSEIFVNIAQIQNRKLWRKSNFWANSVILIAIPSKIYRIDEEILVQSLKGQHIPKIPGYSEKFDHYKYFANALKADQIRIIPEVKLAAVGAGAPIWAPQGVFILDIGGGTSDCALISAGDIIVQDSITLVGNKIDEHLKKFIEGQYYLKITREEVEAAKIECGCRWFWRY